MKRFTGSITLVLLALALFTGPAGAARLWCRVDPVVTLNGTTVQILVAVPEEYVPAVTGAIDVDIALPDGVTRQVDYLDPGFNGYGETVSFQSSGATVAADGSFDITIRTRVPVSADVPGGSVPLQVTVITNGELIWEGGLPDVINGETTIVEGDSTATYTVVTVRGVN